MGRTVRILYQYEQWSKEAVFEGEGVGSLPYPRLKLALLPVPSDSKYVASYL